MKTIYHYQIFPQQKWQVLYLPDGAKPIHYQSDHGKLWAIVDSEAPLVPTPIAVIGTGWEIPEGAEWVCTDNSQYFVWHVFKAGEGAE